MADRIEQLRRLLEAEPGDAFCLYSLGQEYARRGDHATAVSHYDLALQSDPDYCYAYYHKAKSLESGRHRGGGGDAATGVLPCEIFGRCTREQ